MFQQRVTAAAKRPAHRPGMVRVSRGHSIKLSFVYHARGTATHPRMETKRHLGPVRIRARRTPDAPALPEMVGLREQPIADASDASGLSGSVVL